MPTSTIVVRQVTPEDLPDFLRLLEGKADFDGVRSTLKATLENLRAELFAPSPATRAVIAVKGTETVGMATYYDTFSSFLMKPGIWLDDLFVLAEHRKSGVGRALLAWLCREAVAHGCARIDWTVAAENDNGRGFYVQMGATISEVVRLARLNEVAIRKLADETPE